MKIRLLLINALYIQAMALIVQEGTFLQEYFEQARALRSVDDLRVASQLMSAVTMQDVASEYTSVAAGWQCLLERTIDQKELLIAHYYFDHQVMVAAANRAWAVAQRTRDLTNYNDAINLVAGAIKALSLSEDQWQSTVMITPERLMFVIVKGLILLIQRFCRHRCTDHKNEIKIAEVYSRPRQVELGRLGRLIWKKQPCYAPSFVLQQVKNTA